jgi:fructose-1,6-bisphosphatase II
MWHPPPDAIYMEKIVVDREAAEALVPECMDAPAAWTLALVARVKNKPVRDLTVVVLNRPPISGTGADILMGIGGVSEGVIAACAVKAVGGAMLARLSPQSEEEEALVREADVDGERIRNCHDLVTSDDVFFAATGITSSRLLRSIRYRGQHVETHSLLIRAATGTVRFIQAEHVIDE